MEEEQKKELKDKLCFAFETFEGEKKKIIDFYKEGKIKKVQMIKSLQTSLIEKENMVLEFEENRLKESQRYQKSMMELEELKHKFRLERGKEMIPFITNLSLFYEIISNLTYFR